MARCKEFDPDEVLLKAMMLFWRQGFEATTVRDLVAYTGINRGSLYGTFGDKRSLFLAVLEYYRNTVSMPFLATLHSSESGLSDIRNYFEEVINFSVTEGRHLGCLMTNTTVELASHDPAITAFSLATLGRMENAFFDALMRAKACGEITTEGNLHALARFLTSNLQGLRVTAKATPDREILQDIVNVIMKALR